MQPEWRAVKVGKWGNSLAVCLPDEVVESLGLKEGDEVEIEAAGGRAIRIGRDRACQAALDSLQALSRPLPPDYRFDRDEANERGGRE